MADKKKQICENKTAEAVKLSKLLALKQQWENEHNKLWDQWEWCKAHNFELEAQKFYALREQLRRKIHEFEKVIEGQRRA